MAIYSDLADIRSCSKDECLFPLAHSWDWASCTGARHPSVPSDCSSTFDCKSWLSVCSKLERNSSGKSRCRSRRQPPCLWWRCCHSHPRSRLWGRRSVCSLGHPSYPCWTRETLFWRSRLHWTHSWASSKGHLSEFLLATASLSTTCSEHCSDASTKTSSRQRNPLRTGFLRKVAWLLDYLQLCTFSKLLS